MKRLQHMAWMAFLVVLGGSVAGSGWAWAQAQATGVAAECAQDVMQLCPNAKTPQARALCLKSQEANLSPACKQVRTKVQETKANAQTKSMEVKEVCKADAETLCKDRKVGSGLLVCLKAHEAELSAACKAALPKGKGTTN